MRGVPAALPLAIFAAALILYACTLAPGLLWGGNDFALYQVWAFFGDSRGEVSVATHPLWIYLAHIVTLLPFRDVAWRANLTSAILAAAALVFVCLAAWRVTRSRTASILATAALALSHTFWTYAVVPKTYSLNALLLVACSYLLLRWREERKDLWLSLFALLYALSLFNHLFMATVALGFGAFIVHTLWPIRRSAAARRSMVTAAVSFAFGLLPLMYFLFGSQAACPAGMALGRIARDFLEIPYHLDHLLRSAVWGAALALFQFPGALFIGLAGLAVLWRRDRATALLVGLGAGGVAAFLFIPFGKHVGGHLFYWSLHLYLHAYVLFSIALAPGFAAIWRTWCQDRLPRRILLFILTVGLPVAFYAAVPAAARFLWRDVRGFRDLSGRDNFVYALSPWKQGEKGARDFGAAILKALPPGSTLFADYSIWGVIHYLQAVEAARPDVTLVRFAGLSGQVPTVMRYRGSEGLFLADANRYYDVAGLRRHFELARHGPIWRLIPKPAIAAVD